MVAEVAFKSIQSFDSNELTKDEIRLFAGDKKIWSGSMNQGDFVDLRHLDPLFFRDSINLQIWEEDRWEPWPLPDIDKDDFLGQNTVHEFQEPGGAFALDFYGSGAHYQIVLDVLA
jgi:hypothetical protein